MTTLDTHDYEYATVRGYVNRGKVKRMLNDGWTIVSVTPVIASGITLTQAMYFMRKAKS